MRKNEKQMLKEAFQIETKPIRPEHVKETVRLSRAAFENRRRGGDKISVPGLALRFARQAGWQIWARQMGAAAAMLAGFHLIVGGTGTKLTELFYISYMLPRFLGCASILFAWLSACRMSRSVKYKMYETERAARCPVNRFYMAYLLLAGAGAAAFLLLAGGVVLMGNYLEIQGIVLYLILPFMILAGIFLHLLRHVHVEWLNTVYTGVCGVFFVLMFAGWRKWTEFFAGYPDRSIWLGAVLALSFVVFELYGVNRHAFYRGKEIKVWN